MPEYPSNANICVYCKNALGGCSWSALDPDTNNVRFEPIPGWTAEKSCIGIEKPFGKLRVIESYHITECPQFERG